MNKPISIVMDETKKSLTSICNNSGLPVIILELLVKDLYQELKFLSNKQLTIDYKEYELHLNEEENKTTESNDEIN